MGPTRERGGSSCASGGSGRSGRGHETDAPDPATCTDARQRRCRRLLSQQLRWRTPPQRPVVGDVGAAVRQEVVAATILVQGPEQGAVVVVDAGHDEVMLGIARTPGGSKRLRPGRKALPFSTRLFDRERARAAPIARQPHVKATATAEASRSRKPESRQTNNAWASPSTTPCRARQERRRGMASLLRFANGVRMSLRHRRASDATGSGHAARMNGWPDRGWR